MIHQWLTSRLKSTLPAATKEIVMSGKRVRAGKPMGIRKRARTAGRVRSTLVDPEAMSITSKKMTTSRTSRMRKRMESILGVELKAIETTLAPVVLTNDPTAATTLLNFGDTATPSNQQTLTPIQAGSGRNERIGRRVRIKSLLTRFVMWDPFIDDNPGPGGYPQGWVRLVLVHVKGNGNNGPGTTPWQDLFRIDQDEGTDLLTGYGNLQFRSLAKTNKYKILYDKQHQIEKPTIGHVFTVSQDGYTVPALGPALPPSDHGSSQASYDVPAVTSTSSSKKYYEEYRVDVNINNLNIPVTYERDVGGSLASDIEDNNLFWLAISNNNTTNVAARCRVRYTDA
jgi:hypothetical protein